MKSILSISAVLMLLLKANAKKVSCYPGIKEQGYECCESPCTIERTDKYGYWGVQNGEECGCGMSGFDKHNIESCSSYYTDQGFKCCDHCDVILKDEKGYFWGGHKHNVTYSGEVWDEWCGISDFCINAIGIVDRT